MRASRPQGPRSRSVDSRAEARSPPRCASAESPWGRATRTPRGTISRAGGLPDPRDRRRGIGDGFGIRNGNRNGDGDGYGIGVGVGVGDGYGYGSGSGSGSGVGVGKRCGTGCGCGDDDRAWRRGNAASTHGSSSDLFSCVLRGRYRARGAGVAVVRACRSEGESSIWSPRRPALTKTVSKVKALSSRSAGSDFFPPIGLMPPTT